MRAPENIDEFNTLVAIIFAVSGFLMSTMGALLLSFLQLIPLAILFICIGVCLFIGGAIAIGSLCGVGSFDPRFLGDKK